MTPVAPPLVAYADLIDEPLVGAAAALLAAADRAAGASAAAVLAAAAFGLDRPVAAAIAERVLASTGPFARAARAGVLGAADPRLERAALELRHLGAVAGADLGALLARHELGSCLPAGTSGRGPERPAAFATLAAALAGSDDWGAQAGAVAAFHRAQGTGPLATHRVLRFREGALAGIDAPDPIALGDLAGPDGHLAALLGDLAALCDGRPPVDTLLYGPPGTGKSATVRACAAELAARDLRLVQIDRDELATLDTALDALAGAGPSCLVFLDDLVFDDAQRGDRALRAALEGGVVARPANVVLWATSNRLGVTHSTFSERADEIDAAEGAGEKAALADRFGRRVRLGRLAQDDYLAIVRHLLVQAHGAVPEGAEQASLRFSRNGHPLSPRTARHFVAAWASGSEQ